MKPETEKKPTGNLKKVDSFKFENYREVVNAV